MEIPESTLDRYSTVTVNKNINYSNSTVSTKDILLNVRDVLNDGYEPWYARRLQELGHKRFMELVGKARAGSDTPKRLFAWFLNNNEVVR